MRLSKAKIVAPLTILALLLPADLAVAQSSLPQVGASHATPGTFFYPPVYRAILGVGADDTQAHVSWRSSTTRPTFVELTDTRTGRTQIFEGSERDHGALLYRSMETALTDLAPATTYSYRIGSPEIGWSESYQFSTGNNAKDWEFLAVADPQIGVMLKNAEQGATWRATLNAATTAHPNAEFIFSLGDQVDGWGPAQAQYDEFFSAPQLRSYPTAVIPGNHETVLGGLRHFDEHFALPNAELRDYAFIKNNVLFIALDSNASSPADLARHEEFVRRAAQQHPDVDWTVVAFHHGPFSQASHASDPDVKALREGLTPVLSELGVDVVLSGHDHIYTRSHLMEGQVPDTMGRGNIGDRLDQKDGHTLYITTTTAGGGKFYDFTDRNGVKHPGATQDTISPELEQPWTAMWHQDYTPDYLAVSVSQGELRLRTVDAPTGTLIDDVTLVKH